MTIKIEEYMKQPLCFCDSCGKNRPTKKIYAEIEKEYQVGIRLCDDCWYYFCVNFFVVYKREKEVEK